MIYPDISATRRFVTIACSMTSAILIGVATAKLMRPWRERGRLWRSIVWFLSASLAMSVGLAVTLSIGGLYFFAGPGRYGDVWNSHRYTLEDVIIVSVGFGVATGFGSWRWPFHKRAGAA